MRKKEIEEEKIEEEILEEIYITNIEWERVNVKITFNEEIEKYDIYLCQKEEIKLNDVKENTVTINITNTPEGTMLEEGKYKIKIEGKLVKVNKDLIAKFDDLSRILKYRGGFYSCEVIFKSNKEFEPSIHINYMMKNKKYKKYIRIVEGKNFKAKMKKLGKVVSYKCINIFYRICRIFSTNSILLLSENSDQLPEGLASLKEELKAKFKIKEYCKNRFEKKEKTNNFFIKRFRYIKKAFSYINEIIKIARSNIIIIENYTPVLNVLSIPKKCKIVQIWHAGVGFKSVGYARFGRDGSPHPFHSSHRKYDFAIIDRMDLKEVYQEVFGIEGSKFIDCGMPRLKEYLKKDVIERDVKELEQINSNFKTKKTILFAPTYRGGGQKTAYYDWDKIDFDKIAEFCKNNNFMFIIKMHPFITVKAEIPEQYKEYILDYSDYSINKLIYLSDILITDYSSCVYEFLMFNRPVIFYRYDKEIYEYVRPIHTLKKLYNEENIATDFEGLLNLLEKYKEINIEERFKNVVEYEKKSYESLIEEILK